jgi:antitoxin VapB
MPVARIFRSGNSQCIRLPKEFRFAGREVEIFRRGEDIVLREQGGSIARAFELLAGLPPDFEPRGRNKDFPQKRKGL